jgi:signal transduction histidine kinase
MPSEPASNRVVQEALTHCARHANARTVLVSVAAQDDGIAVTVRDDGIGFSSNATIREGLGLLGMRERVQALEGDVTIFSEPRRGTTITCAFQSVFPREKDPDCHCRRSWHCPHRLRLQLDRNETLKS